QARADSRRCPRVQPQARMAQGGGHRMTETKRIAIQISRPSGPGDNGVVEEGHYRVEDGIVRLTDATGRPLLRASSTLSARGSQATQARWERRLREGEEARQAARELLWARYRASKRGSDFNRPLNWPPVTVA